MSLAKLLETTTTVALEGNTLILRDDTAVLRYALSHEVLLALKDWASDDTDQPPEFPNIHQVDLLAEAVPIEWKMKKASRNKVVFSTNGEFVESNTEDNALRVTWTLCQLVRADLQDALRGITYQPRFIGDPGQF